MNQSYQLPRKCNLRTRAIPGIKCTVPLASSGCQATHAPSGNAWRHTPSVLTCQRLHNKDPLPNLSNICLSDTCPLVILALSGSESGPLSTPCCLAASSPSNLCLIGGSRTLATVSLPLSPSSSAAVALFATLTRLPAVALAPTLLSHLLAAMCWPSYKNLLNQGQTSTRSQAAVVSHEILTV